MKNQIISLCLVLVFISCLSLTSAAIERIPLDVSYNNGTQQLTISGENLFFTKLMTESFVTQIYVVKTVDGDIINLQLAMANMTSMCNDTLGYVSKYVACETRNKELENMFLEMNNTKDLYENCTKSLEACNKDLTYWQTNGMSKTTCQSEVESAKSKAQNDKWIWVVVALIAGVAGCYFFMKYKKAPKNPEGLASFPRGS